jgi:deoxyribonuclease-4
MLTIGTQLSSSKGFEHLGKEALAIGANTFQFFMRNPRGTRAKAIKTTDIEKLRSLLAKNHFGQIIAHSPYTLNPCSKNAHLRELSAEMFADDLARMQYLPGNLYNMHPGSRTGLTTAIAIDYIAEMLNSIITREHLTTVLLETMSGKGSEIGQTFEELYAILEKVKLEDKVGVCFDACHLWDAGYDIVGQLDDILEHFDRIIGLNKLKAFHINNSKNILGSHKDRHAPIGKGYIELEGIVAIINHPQLRHLPFITETPIDIENHRQEIALLRSKYEEEHL